MRVKLFIVLLFCMVLLACSQNITTENPTVTPINVTSTLTQKSSPTLASTSSENRNPTETTDLSAFSLAWSSHDVSRIRDFYTEDARYFPESEIYKLENGQPIDVLVSDDVFQERANQYQGFSMRVIGNPVMIFDKLVAFSYRWENETEGYNGMALLRYEEHKVFLHTDIISNQLTPNQTDESSYYKDPVNLDSLMHAWNEADLILAQTLYTEGAAIVSDEDLAQAPWRDFSSPANIGKLLPTFMGWNPTIIGQPVQIDDKVFFPWRWYKGEYPVGYGVRLLKYNGSSISMDIRFVIRPWEANGQPFMNP
jgi:hypothetical protein